MSTYIEQVAADHSKVCQSFDELRRHQVENVHGRAYTPMDDLVTSLFFRTANMAVQDVFDDEAGRPWSGIALRAIPLDTGTGKTQSAVAYIANALQLDPQFSAVYVAGSIRGLLDVMKDFEKLGVECAISFSNRHGERDDDVAEAGESFVSNRYALKNHRVVLVTHKFWAEDTKAALTHWRGWRRSIVIIDECPELVDLRRCNPDAVQKMLSQFNGVSAPLCWRRVLGNIVARMNNTMLLTGPTFTPEALVTPEEASDLGVPERSDLEPYVPSGLSDVERARLLSEWLDVFWFLHYASKDACFYSKREKLFFSYKPKFDPKPGHIMLDATADVHELVTLMPGAETEVMIPKVDYAHLTLLHVEHPKEFKSRSVTKSFKGAAPYAAWMRSIVLANTAPGDDVLVVTNKNIVEHRYLEPMDVWEGRKVACVWWGGPFAGTNRYKHKTHVFCFGEAHRPRSIDVADVHGVSMLPLSVVGLKDAESRPGAGEEYAPTGIYLKPWEGRLLAMTKQAAMRGRARNIDETAQALPMTLVTTMPIKRLADNLTALFPGSAYPRAGRLPDGAAASASIPTRKAPNRVQALRRELGTTEHDRLGAEEVEARLGIPRDKLGDTFKKSSMPGWRLVSSADLGLSGRQKWLVRDAA